MIERPNDPDRARQSEYMHAYTKVAARAREVDNVVANLRRQTPKNEAVVELHAITGNANVRMATMRRWSVENQKTIESLGERYERATAVLKKYDHLLFNMPEEGIQELLSALREE